MLQKPVELKSSNFTLAVIHISDAQPEDIYRAIQKKIEQAPAFLQNAPVIINVANLNHKSNWLELYQAVSVTGLHVVGVSGCNNSKLKQEIICSGLPILTEGKSPTQSIPLNKGLSTALVVIKTQLINNPIRSGQQVYARNSDLIITNSVSAGAEIVADGNIHIYGIMRGRALAGASGDKESKIFCTNFYPELVSICGQYWLRDQIPTEFLGKSAQLSLQDSMLTIQSLN